LVVGRAISLHGTPCGNPFDAARVGQDWLVVGDLAKGRVQASGWLSQHLPDGLPEPERAILAETH
jgi:hypothetical protein